MTPTLLPRERRRPLLLGAVIDREEFVLSIGITGRCTFSVSDQERNALLGFLARFDGRTEWGQIARQIHSFNPDEVLAALITIDAVVDDVGNAWGWFSRLYENPGWFSPPMSADAAYSLQLPSPFPKWDSADVEYLGVVESATTGLSARKRSLNLSAIDSSRAPELESVALEIAAIAVSRQANGHPYYSSAGGMLPLHLIAFIPNSASGDFDLILVEPWNSQVRRISGIAATRLAECFIADREILGALQNQPIVFVHVADPRRITAKYGNRGWLYCAIEAGQVNHRIELAANALGLHSRPIGGFCEHQLSELVGLDGASALLTTFVGYDC